MYRYTDRRRAIIALNAQPVGGFSVEVGTKMHEDLNRYFVTHPYPGKWALLDRRRNNINDPVVVGTITEVLDAVFL